MITVFKKVAILKGSYEREHSQENLQGAGYNTGSVSKGIGVAYRQNHKLVSWWFTRNSYCYNQSIQTKSLFKRETKNCRLFSKSQVEKKLACIITSLKYNLLEYINIIVDFIVNSSYILLNNCNITVKVEKR